MLGSSAKVTNVPGYYLRISGIYQVSQAHEWWCPNCLLWRHTLEELHFCDYSWIYFVHISHIILCSSDKMYHGFSYLFPIVPLTSSFKKSRSGLKKKKNRCMCVNDDYANDDFNMVSHICLMTSDCVSLGSMGRRQELIPLWLGMRNRCIQLKMKFDIETLCQTVLYKAVI